jgi:hypothetical protein
MHSARRKLVDAMLLSILQPLRIAGDFLNIGLGVKSARNTLGPVDAQTASTWAHIWRGIRGKPGLSPRRENRMGKKMRIALTGASGNFGREFMSRADGDVIAVNRGDWNGISGILSRGVDVVIHAASDLQSSVARSPANWLDSTSSRQPGCSKR